MDFNSLRLSCLVPLLFVAMIAGCSESPPPAPEPDQQVEQPASDAGNIEDPAAAVEIVTEAAKSVRKNGNGQIIEVDLTETEVSDELLAALPELPRLRSLLLRESSIGDEGLVHVGKCAALENLDLRECLISNDGLAHLTGLNKLKAIRFAGQSGDTSVDDEGMQHLAELPALKVIALDFLWVSGEGLADLKPLNELRELYLAETLVGDSDLVVLENFPQLRKLRLSKLSNLTGTGIAEVAKLQHLEELDLSEGSSIFDADVEPLGQLTTLKKLNLWRTPITNAGVHHLEPLTNLVWLNLDNTQLSDDGLTALKGMQNLEFLHLGSTQITNAGLPTLAELDTLDKLVVTRTEVTQEGVDKLRPDLPDTEIQLEYLGNN